MHHIYAPYNFHIFGFSEHVLVLLSSSVMQLQEWLRSLFSHAETKVFESDDVWTLLPSLPSLSLSTSSLLGLGALASLTVCWLVTRPRPMSPPCDLQAQSVAVGVSASLRTAAFTYLVCVVVCKDFVCLQGDPSCRRSALIKDDTLLEFYHDDVRTVYEMFQRGLKVSGDERGHVF